MTKTWISYKINSLNRLILVKKEHKDLKAAATMHMTISALK